MPHQGPQPSLRVDAHEWPSVSLRIHTTGDVNPLSARKQFLSRQLVAAAGRVRWCIRNVAQDVPATGGVRQYYDTVRFQLGGRSKLGLALTPDQGRTRRWLPGFSARPGTRSARRLTTDVPTEIDLVTGEPLTQLVQRNGHALGR